LLTLKFNQADINKLLINLGSKLNSKSLLSLNKSEEGIEGYDNIFSDIENHEDFIEIWGNIFKILSEKLGLNEDIINKDKELFIDIFNLIQFCINNKLGSITNIYKFNGLKEFMNKLNNLDKSKLTQTVNTRKRSKVVPLRPGAINSDIKFELIQIKSYLENILSNSLLTLTAKTNQSENLKNKITQITSDFYELYKNDYNYLYKNYIEGLNLRVFLDNISKDLSDSNINSKYDQLIKFIQNIDMSMDDLYYATNLFNTTFTLDSFKISERINTLNINSDFIIKCNEIINDKKVLDNGVKQLMLEKFILGYEKEFILNLIHNLDNNIKNYKLLARIYKHSTPHFENRIESIIRQHLIRNSELYNSNKKDLNKIGDNLALSLFIVLDVKDIINILFSKVIRLISTTNGIKQTQLINQLGDEMFITFKFNSDLVKLKNKLSEEELIIVTEVKKGLELRNLPIDSKIQFGQLLLDLLMDEFSYIFERIMIYDNNESNIYISITKEYLRILSSIIFNPIKLPMIVEPKIWSDKNIGGYLLDEFNELVKNNEIVRSNPYLKIQSSITNTQINTINFLNSIPFEINKNMLNFIKIEGEKEGSIIFNGYNKLHPLADKINDDNIDSKLKLDIISHNSLYWNYTYIINIALLMKNNTIYLPTFLDFRGRIYPSPNYLSYQGGDLARSLLLFKDVGKKIGFEETADKILDTTISKKLLINKLADIDYVKLYLANVFGLNKINRKNRIKWFDINIKEILYLLNNNFELFYIKYLSEAKEPAQFIACLFEYNNWSNKEITDIKTPILFDATCSGVQHLSALTSDLDIAKLVNITESVKDGPSDFYEFCIKNIIKNINNLPDSDSILKFKLLKLNLTRKILKHSIMTVPYNVTPIGIADKIATVFDKSFIKLEEAVNLEKASLITFASYDTQLIESDKAKELRPTEVINNNNAKREKELISFSSLSDEHVPMKESHKRSKKVKDGIYIYKPLMNMVKSEYQSEINNLIFTQKRVKFIRPDN
jgi:hypothetical protein